MRVAAAPQARLERATYCLGGTPAPALRRPANRHVAAERNSHRQLLSERSSIVGRRFPLDRVLIGRGTLSAGLPMLGSADIHWEWIMTSPHATPHPVMPSPACTPAAIRAVLAANADTAVLQRYDEELDAAFEEARERGDLTPLLETVHRWRFEADAWRDPEAQREFLARIEKYHREGPPPAEKRISWQEIRAQYGL
jgi:Family of unknown function (DUF6247)